MVIMFEMFIMVAMDNWTSGSRREYEEERT